MIVKKRQFLTMIIFLARRIRLKAKSDGIKKRTLLINYIYIYIDFSNPLMIPL